MIDEIIQSTKTWPKDFVLVIHGLDMTPQRLSNAKIDFIDCNEMVYLSQAQFLLGDDFSDIILSADIGLAFWQSTIIPGEKALYGGLNTEIMGMSSGKLAKYLQHGVPVITNISGEMRTYITAYNLGVVVDDIDQLPGALTDATLIKGARSNCLKFYNEKLDLRKNISPFLSALER